jgi:hypothetical protein
MTSKPFDLELYNQDDKAKLLVIDWMAKHGIKSWVNPDTYGIDLLGQGPKGDYEVEVEVKHNWRGPIFPFDTVHFSARKNKFAKNSPNNLFVMLNDGLTHALIVPGKALIEGKRVVKNTVYTKAESFIQVDVSKCNLCEVS